MCRKRDAIRSRKSPSFRFRSPQQHLRLHTTNSNNPVTNRSNHTMKKFSVFALIAALAVFVSCQKQSTEEERKAEVERQVQERLAAEKAAGDKEQLAKQQAELDAREKALADREAAAAASPTAVVEEAAAPPSEGVVAESDGGNRSETRSTATYGMFYEKLDPYGEWRETKDYGYVFQPREAESSRDWRPYTEGHWVYSDAGWTWVSDEPFGWAAYHYGRWVKLRRVGWVWVPGEEWAPAWVSWRSSKDYVGWAPLPPEARFDRRSGIHNWADSYYDIGPDQYSFVSCNDFGAEHVRRAVVPQERNVTIVVETTNVTRITFSNTMIVTEGPSYDELRSRGPRPIERYRLRRERNTEATVRISGNELEVSVPILSEVRNIFRPRRVKERVTEVNVDNGWTSVSDRSAAERARTKIRGEATPPPNAPPKKFVPPAETAPTTAASATPAATVAASPATMPPSATPAHSATPTPVATAASSTSPSPGASAPRTRPSPSMRPRSSPSPAASPTAAATTAPAASATPTPAIAPTTRPRPSLPLRSSPPPAASPTAAATTAPAASATPTPAISIAPRTRPSPSIPVRMSPTPLPTSSPEITTPPVAPRRTLPPVSTTPTPRTTPSAATEPSVKPLPTFTPVRRPPIPPRPTLPTPTVAPETSETARPPMPREIPRRTIPPRLTPPPAASPAATPSVAPSAPAATDERPKNRRPPRPAPVATESETPTPAPSTPPN